jgi:hypothetical protein
MVVVVSVLFLLMSPPPSVTAGDMIAERITESNASQYLCDSPDRAGGIGDWYLANDVVWAIVDDVSNANVISSAGGTVVDLGLLSHKGEQLVQIMPLVNMTRDLIVPYDDVRAENAEDRASITVTATHGLRPEKPGLGVLSKEDAEKVIIKTKYELRPGESFMRITTTISNNGDKKAKIFYFGDLIYWGDDTLKPFAGSQKKLGRARGAPRGFDHPLIDTSSLFSIVNGTGGFNYVAGGGVDGNPPISYGICSPSEHENSRMLWGINDHMVSVVGPFLGKFNRPLDLWKIFFLGIAKGEQFEYERIVVVGNRNDIASSTDTIFQLLGTVQDGSGVAGKIEPADADTSIKICTAEDKLPVTQIRPERSGEQAGAFRALLPPGDYVAEIRSVCRDPELATPEMEPITKRFTVAASGPVDIGTTKLPDLSILRVEVFESDSRVPARVIIQGVAGAPDPELGSDLLGFTLGEEPRPSTYGGNWLLLDGNETVPVEVGLRPGKYKVYATRGFEYSIAEKEVDLSTSASKASIRLDIERVIDTRGMMNGDFHVHAAPSPDSAVSYEQRVKSFVAEGVDLLIATDHDALMHYAPVIEKLNLSHRLMSIVGVESTSTQMVSATPYTVGHTNAWPLKYDPIMPRWGMFYDEELRPRDLFDRLREIADGKPVIQINHGRGGKVGAEGSYFNALGIEFDQPLGYDPTLPLTESPNNILLVANANGTRDIDFDAMEILNSWAYDEYLLLRDDWFSLLNQGYVKTGTANSDTHTIANLAGYPRNYILLEDPEARRADKETLCEQIRKQKVFGTTGPIIQLDIGGEATIGDTVTVEGGKVDLNIKVSAAPWVPLGVIRIWANGEIVQVLKPGPQTEILRLNQSLPLALEKDSWIVVEATMRPEPKSGEPSCPGGLYNIVAPRMSPLAFTNPIFVDIDGNGRFDPPGISSHPEN